MKTNYIGIHVKENDLIKTYQDEILFYGCYFDGHWLSEIKCKKIYFIGCYFNRESELSKAIFEKVSFKNCFFCEPLEIHIHSNITNWKDCIIVDDDSDCKITIYKNNQCISKTNKEVLPRQFKDFVSLRHYDTDNVYDQLENIYHYCINKKNIDCTPIISGLITEASEIVQRDTIQYLLSNRTDSIWYNYIMQVIFNWIHAPYIIDDISFVSHVKPTNEWHIPSFSRIFSSNWFDVTDGMESILRCFKYNPSLLEESFCERIKYLVLNHDKTSVVSYGIQILLMKEEKDLLKNVFAKRSELIEKFKDTEVLELIKSVYDNLSH